MDGEVRVDTARDIRFTTRKDVTGDYVYAILLARPDDGVARVRAFGTGSGLLTRGIQAVSVLGEVEPSVWSRDAEELRVELGAQNAELVGAVVKIYLEPVVVPARHDFLH